MKVDVLDSTSSEKYILYDLSAGIIRRVILGHARWFGLCEHRPRHEDQTWSEREIKCLAGKCGITELTTGGSRSSADR